MTTNRSRGRQETADIINHPATAELLAQIERTRGAAAAHEASILLAFKAALLKLDANSPASDVPLDLVEEALAGLVLIGRLKLEVA